MVLQAFNKAESVGRRHSIDEDSCYQGVDPYVIDYQKILNSKAYRRLQKKTQVFSLNNNIHVRNRADHSNEVIANSLILSQSLGLNDYLCKAIAAGHDTGHTPYGHVIEKLLDSELKKEGSFFKHNYNSVIVLEEVERKGKGLNLTHETLEGIIHHSRGQGKATTNQNVPAEYMVVMYSDKFCYTTSDFNDAYIRQKEISPGKPEYKKLFKLANKLGRNQRERMATLNNALIQDSQDLGYVGLRSDNPINIVFEELKTEMYTQVYHALSGNDDLIRSIVKPVYNLLVDASKEELYHACLACSKNKPYEALIKSHEYELINKPHPALLFSLLTDDEVLSLYLAIFKRQLGLNINRLIEVTSLNEVLPYLMNKSFDSIMPAINW